MIVALFCGNGLHQIIYHILMCKGVTIVAPLFILDLRLFMRNRFRYDLPYSECNDSGR